MEIDESEILFMTGEAAFIKEVEEGPSSLADLLPDFILAEDGVIREILLEIEGTQEDIGCLTLAIVPKRQVTGLCQNHGIDGFPEEGYGALRSGGFGRDHETGTPE
jgi:hypothetical protein